MNYTIESITSVFFATASTENSESIIMKLGGKCLLIVCLLSLSMCGSVNESNRSAEMENQYDLIIRNGMVYDGGGGPPVKEDVAVKGDKIAAIGGLKSATARSE